jgi:SAM-dependent methyltransferase
LDNNRYDKHHSLVMQDLATQQYIRERIAPRPGDPDYLHLSDLLIGLKMLIPQKVTRVLDYGCGGSPYRTLFESCTYHRSDLVGSELLDFQYGPDSRLPAELSNYDCVLSSQVLEHVISPSFYLAECYRILKPGGSLVLSTHGIFEDHACPDDFWRWTGFGLRKLVEQAGFHVDRILKLTSGPRAVMFIAERELFKLRFSGSGLYSLMLDYGARVVRRAGARRRHEACDASFPRHRASDADQDGHDLYIALALVAQR